MLAHHLSAAVLAAADNGADNGGNLIFKYADIRANLVQWLLLGFIALALTGLFQRQNRQGGRLIGLIVVAGTCAFIAFAPWEHIAGKMSGFGNW